MNKLDIRTYVRQLIKEAKEHKLPKSSGKLVDLKKELVALENMKAELQAAKFAEKTASTEVEFANLSKFAKELDKIKQGGIALEASIDNKIAELKNKINSEKSKIKEMIGLSPKKNQETINEPKSEEEEKDNRMSYHQSTSVMAPPDEDEDKPGLEENKKPSTGMTKKEKSAVVKKARAGKDIGKKGKGFEKVAKAAGGGEKGKKVAASVMWKQQAKK
jgi:hypothetical protein